MKTINESISYTVEWRGSDKSSKTAGFSELNRAQEHYDEKRSEGKRPKLFLIRKIMTKEQVFVK